VPGDRPVRAGHRRAGLPEAGHSGHSPILHPRTEHHQDHPVEVITDKAAVYLPVLEELAPGSWHHTEPYANNSIEAEDGRVKSRLRPMRGLQQLRCAQVISAGHAFVQNLRRGRYELGIEEPLNLRVLAGFNELATAI
jgi:transposase-like protein